MIKCHSEGTRKWGGDPVGEAACRHVIEDHSRARMPEAARSRVLYITRNLLDSQPDKGIFTAWSQHEEQISWAFPSNRSSCHWLVARPWWPFLPCISRTFHTQAGCEAARTTGSQYFTNFLSWFHRQLRPSQVIQTETSFWHSLTSIIDPKSWILHDYFSASPPPMIFFQFWGTIVIYL